VPDVLIMEMAVKHGVSYLLEEVQLSLEGFLLPDVFMSGTTGVCK